MTQPKSITTEPYLDSLADWFRDDVYDPLVGHERIRVIRAGVAASSFFMGHPPRNRSLAEVVNENYRVLLRRIDELEADLAVMLSDDDDAA